MIARPADVRASVARWAPRLTDVLRYVRSKLPNGQRQADPYVGPLAKSVLSYDPPRSKCLEQVLAFVIDEAHRGELADAERLGNELVAIARVEYERVHGVVRLGFGEAHAAEQHAEGLKNDAETAMVHEATQRADRRPSCTAIERFLSAKAVHDVADERLAVVLRRFDSEVPRS
jgi:hypothetical protein